MPKVLVSPDKNQSMQLVGKLWLVFQTSLLSVNLPMQRFSVNKYTSEELRRTSKHVLQQTQKAHCYFFDTCTSEFDLGNWRLDQVDWYFYLRVVLMLVYTQEHTSKSCHIVVRTPFPHCEWDESRDVEAGRFCCEVRSIVVVVLEFNQLKK